MNYGQKHFTRFSKKQMVEYENDFDFWEYYVDPWDYMYSSPYTSVELNNTLAGLKNRTLTTTYPAVSEGNCSLLLVTNLAYPQWVSVHCYDAMLDHIVCFKRKQIFVGLTVSGFERYVCAKSALHHSGYCYSFPWKNKNTESSKNNYNPCSPQDLNVHVQSRKGAKRFLYLFHTTILQKISLLSIGKQKDQFIQSTSEKIWLKPFYNERFVRSSEAEGHMICPSKKLKLPNVYNHTFSCQNKQIISSFYICDGDNDCSDTWPISSDETECHGGRQILNQIPINTCGSQDDSHQCKYRVFPKRSWVSHARSDSLEHRQTDKQHGSAEDQDRQNYKKTKSCQIPGQFSCDEACSESYGVSDICLYSLNVVGNLVPCKYGSHLQECASFECSQRYKCPGFYCIAFAYVQDGKWDCPSGQDEGNFNSCVSEQQDFLRFKCKNVQICIPLGDVCDTAIDCPLKDDEIMCDIKNTCPLMCFCYLYSLSCRNMSISHIFLGNLSYSIFHLSLTDMSGLSTFRENLHAEVIKMSKNKVENICSTVSSVVLLRFFDVSQNKLTSIKGRCFVELFALKVVLLNRNNISSFESKSFVHLNKLSLVDVSHNVIEWLPSDIFDNVSQIYSLKLTNNRFAQLEKNMFKTFPVKLLIADKFHVCCITPPEMVCPTDVPWFTSCSFLFPNKAMRMLFISASLAVLVTNGLSLCEKMLRMAKFGRIHVFNIFVFFINSGDLLCALYLIIIWVADFFYGDTFVLDDLSWRRNILCTSAFGVMLDFSFFMPPLLVLLSVARLMVVLFPFNSKFKSKEFVLPCLLLVTLAVASISGILTFIVSCTGTLPSSLCSPFIDPTRSDSNIKAITLIVATIQCLSFVTMSGVYFSLAKVLKESSCSDILESQQAVKKSVTLQLVLVTASNLLCWLPSSAIFLSSLFQALHSVDLLFWATTALVPVNSVLNPVIFLSVTLRQHCTCLRRSPSPKTRVKTV